MIWGLLIAAVLTAGVVLVITTMKPKKIPELLSWAVAAVGFVLLWVLGGRMVEHVQTRSYIKATTEQAVAVADGLVAETQFAELVRNAGFTQLAGDAVGSALMGFYTKRIWMCVVGMVVVTAAMALLFSLFMQSRRGGVSHSRSSDEGYSTRGRFEDF